MSDIERLTIDLPADMAAAVKDAVEAGDYATSSDLVQDALLAWTARRQSQAEAVAELQSNIDRGMADIAAGRVYEFDVDQIVERGRALSANRSRSA